MGSFHCELDFLDGFVDVVAANERAAVFAGVDGIIDLVESGVAVIAFVGQVEMLAGIHEIVVGDFIVFLGDEFSRGCEAVHGEVGFGERMVTGAGNRSVILKGDGCAKKQDKAKGRADGFMHIHRSLQ